jgi:hypothetical protein
MSVYIADFNPNGSTTEWLVIHDDAPGGAHSGTIDPTTIVRTTNMDGTPNENFATITCPVCDSVSTHPVGGGAQPPLVQELFIRLAMQDGCVCPDKFTVVGRAGADLATTAHDHVKAHCEAMDGAGRWQVTDEQLAGMR